MKQRILAVGVPLLIYLFATLPALFSSHHLLRNLEPYPDGVLYLIPAQNLAAGKAYALLNEQNQLKAWVPPLYSILLIPGFFLFHTISSFYITNLLLGCIAIVAIYELCRIESGSIWFGCVASCLYVLHGYILFLPSLPMSENAVMALISVSLLLLKLEKKRVAPFIGLVAATAGLFLTKYAVFGVSTVLFFGTAWQAIQTKNRKIWLGILGAVIVLGSFFSWYQFGFLQHNPLAVFSPQLEQKSHTQLTAYAFSYLAQNLRFYAQTIVGGHTHFLWMTEPFTSPILLLAVLCSVILAHRKRLLKSRLGIYFAIVCGQMALLLPFYSQDARYIIALIPVFCAICAVGYSLIERRDRKHFFAAATFLCIFAISQLGLYKYILSANLLHHTTAWQYEAVMMMNHDLHDGDYVITVLPPYVVSVYATQAFHVLPLSPTQEFMNSRQFVWGNLPYDTLTRYFQALLEQDKHVFVSTAYLSSQHQFDNDFKQLEQQFSLTLVSSGCANTCDLYQLHASTSAAHKVQSER